MSIHNSFFSLIKRRSRLPVILQTEVAECGHACVAMISSFHGKILDIGAIRKIIPTSLKGSTLKDLIRLAGKVQLSSRALRINIAQLKSIKLPAILHWELDHFVVLERVKNNFIVIHDPAHGKRTVPMTDVSMSFTGIALELTPLDAFTKESAAEPVRFRDLVGNAIGLKRSLLQIFTLSVLLQLFAFATPLFMQFTIDQIVLSSDHQLLNLLAVGFLFVIITKTATEALRSWVILYLNSTLDLQLMSKTFGHLIRLPMTFFERRHLGDVMSRFDSLRHVREIFARDMVETVIDGLMALMTLSVMAVYSWTLTFTVAGCMIIYATIRLATFTINARLKNEKLAQSAKERTYFMEAIRAILPMKLFAKEEQREAIWQNRYTDALNANIRLRILEIVYDLLTSFLLSLSTILVIWLGAYKIMEGLLSIGQLSAFLVYQTTFTYRANGLIDKLLEFRLTNVDLGRLSDILYTEQENVNENKQPQAPDFSGNIVIRNVSFRYGEEDNTLIQCLSFDTRPGETVVITGKSGSGKSTLLKIMLGLLKPESGEIYYEGLDINKIDGRSLREQIGVVMQDDKLISGTILENIAFFDTNIDIERAVACAKLAHIHEDIIKMPMGYNCLIGDMGTSLSGGQRQRIQIARALYPNPRILFLDEASSNLDMETEALVVSKLRNMPITKLIIAHRRETIALADRVIDLSAEQDPTSDTRIASLPGLTGTPKNEYSA